MENSVYVFYPFQIRIHDVQLIDEAQYTCEDSLNVTLPAYLELCCKLQAAV